MSLTGKRNVKIDAKVPIPIAFKRDLSGIELEDYIEVIDSGMEAVEEKEVHLQGVKKGSSEKIPLPVIKEIANPARKFYTADISDKKIVWMSDCENRFIFDEEEKKFLRENYKKGDEIDVNRIGESAGPAGDVDGEVFRFALNRTIPRCPRQGQDSGVYFRKRSVTPTIRIRKNAGLMQEKISRLGGEFIALKKLCKMQHRKLELERQYIETTAKLIQEFLASGLSRRLKRIYRRKILERKKHIRPSINIFKLMTDRQKILALNSKQSAFNRMSDLQPFDKVQQMDRPITFPSDVNLDCVEDSDFDALWDS